MDAKREPIKLTWLWAMLSFIGLILLLYLVFVVVIIRRNSAPPIEYERIFPKRADVCADSDIDVDIVTNIRRSPAVVAVVENWVSLSPDNRSYFDRSPAWRIIQDTGVLTTTTRIDIPPLDPGTYEYRRALGLSSTQILTATFEVQQC